MRCGRVDDCLALHVVGDGDIHEAEDGWCDVAYFQIVFFAGVRAVFEDKDTVLGVVGIVWSGVVFKGVDGAMAYCANRTPVQVAEIDDQVRGDVVDGAVNILRFEDLSRQGSALVVGNVRDFLREFVAQDMVLFGGHNALWFASGNVEKDACVIATCTPCLGFCPVDFEILISRRLVGIFFGCQIPFADQPFVDADAAIYALGAVV